MTTFLFLKISLPYYKETHVYNRKFGREEARRAITHNLSTHAYHEHYKIFSSIHFQLKII